MLIVLVVFMMLFLVDAIINNTHQWARTVLIVERGIAPAERLRQQDLYRCFDPTQYFSSDVFWHSVIIILINYLDHHDQ